MDRALQCSRIAPPLHIPGLVVKACSVGHDSQSWEMLGEFLELKRPHP